MDKILDFFSTPLGFILLVIFVLLLTIYITGYKKSQRNEIIIINGYKDYITLIVCLISIPVSLFLPFDATVNLFIGIGIFTVSVVLTFYYSIIGNRENRKNIVISTLTKLFILIIFVLVFIIRAIEIIYASLDENKDKRYRDGTKGNLLLAAHSRNRRYTDRFIKNLIK